MTRQWDLFTASFLHFFSIEGAFTYGAALAAVKVLHELGHGYMAARFGCRVPSMGVIFLVMFPVLYTDVTDAWRLQSRRQRLLIDAAGIIVELAVACVATFLWAFLPDGPARSVCFRAGDDKLGDELLINLNPLMRFDGYYIMSDMIRIDNLAPRAFDLGRWRVREILFGLGQPCPEALPRRMVTVLIFYAWATWIYRLILFTGIALMVYHLVFKALGLVLFLVEIICFIVLPVMREMGHWWRIAPPIRRNARTIGSAAALAATCWHVSCPGRRGWTFRPCCRRRR